MIAELISVGTEILMGNIVNTNAQYLSRECAKLGLKVYYQQTVGDNEARLSECIAQAIKRSDVVILTGGLGPTEDDLTKETVAKVLNRALITNEEALIHLEECLSKLAKEIAKNNYKQAEVIEGCIVLQNSNGTAPGAIVEDNNKIIIILPGPPNEMKPMFSKQVFPYLKEKNNSMLFSRMVKMCGIGESMAETKIKDMIDSQTNPTIAPYAKLAEVDFRVTAYAQNEEEADKLIAPIIDELYNRFGDMIFTLDEEETISTVVVNKLKEKNLKISIAESITGGLIAKMITDCPGASQILERSYITYSNEAKIAELNVDRAIIEQYGVVSEETAIAMVEGVYSRTAADVCVAITGIAGPTGGTELSPVGTVFFAIKYNNKIVSIKKELNGNRDKIREYAAINVLNQIRLIIK